MLLIIDRTVHQKKMFPITCAIIELIEPEQALNYYKFGVTGAFGAMWLSATTRVLYTHHTKVRER